MLGQKIDQKSTHLPRISANIYIYVRAKNRSKEHPSPSNLCQYIYMLGQKIDQKSTHLPRISARSMARKRSSTAMMITRAIKPSLPL